MDRERGRERRRAGARQTVCAGRAVVALAILWSALSGPLAAQGGSDAARFDRDRLPDSGRQRARLTVPAFGRYAVAVESKTGVALRVVDRMSGAGEVAGETGARDGRVDLFLDRGEVRVETFGPTLGRGEARLTARSFAELSGVEPPRLVEHRLVSTELGDLEQRSFWIEIPARRRVVLEAAGRFLADLRLWQAGSWLVDAEPSVERIEPVEGRPLALLRLSADLAPGLYLLSAYGGAETPWARGGAEQPLHLRWGLPRRGVAGRDAATLGPFGFERFLVPGRASYFRLELPAARDAELEVATWKEDDPFAGGATWQITKESVPPVAEAERESQEEAWLVTVRGAAGQPYVLQHFEAARRVPLAGAGSYWIGTVHAGFAADSIDATGVLFAAPAGDWSRTRVLAAQAIELAAAGGWARRFNLLATATLFLHVAEAGSYELAARGAAAQHRIEPLVISPPAGYEPPPLRPAPATWDLDPGYYVLTLVPGEAGIVDVALKRRGRLDPLLDWVGLGAEPPRVAVVGAVRLGVVELAANTSYVLLTNEQPGIRSGPLVRKLPLDLEAALPVSLGPGEEIVIPARAREASVAVARAEDGARLELAIDALPAWREEIAVEPGTHRLRLRSTRSEPVAATVGFEPVAHRAEVPLPALDPAALAALPDFPRLDAETPRALDLARRASATFLVEARAPALYLAETTGLLATEASLRTRVRPRLAAAAENGSGRNAAVRAFLREGEYQLAVGARGESAGHLGVRLRRAAIRDGGRLADGWSARATLARDGAVAYGFAVEEAGRHRLRALALGGRFELRIEDAEGYPVGAPVVAGEVTLELEPGEYRAIVLPRGVPARALVRLDRVREPEPRVGHGPHALALDVETAAVWTEPEAGAEREPDRWRFTLPAAANVVAALSDEMEGEIVARGGGPERRLAGRVPPGGSFRGELGAGDYQLEVRCSRRNNRAPYRVSVTTAELVVGVERELALPTSVGVALGGAAAGAPEIEIASFGDADVRARLYDAAGALVAASDDRPDDWNFLVAGRFAPGRYRLRLDPVGAASAATGVAVRLRPERAEAAWDLASGPRALEIGEAIALVPLAFAREAELIALGGRAAEPVALALDRSDGGAWQEIARAEGREPLLALPLAAGAEGGFRLRLRALDGRPTAVRLTGFAGAPARATEAALARGVALEPLRGLEPPLAVLAVDVGRRGCFTATAAGDGELISARRAGTPMLSRPGALVAAGDRLWLGAAGGEREPVQARRVAVAATPVALQLDPGVAVVCDLAPGGGPLAVEATALAGDLLLRPLGAGVAPSVDRVVAVAPQRALALAFGATAIEVAAAGAEPVEARISARALAESAGEPLAAGALELELAPGTARRIAFADGDEGAVALVLGAGAVARFDDERAPYWAAGELRAVRWVGRAAGLLVANPTPGPIQVRVERRRAGAGEGSAELAPGAPFERRFAAAGGLRLAVAPVAPASVTRLRVRGARAALYVGADGQVARGADFGADLTLGAGGGTLWLEHGAGPVVAWLEGEGSPLAAAALADEVPADSLTAPAAIPLAGGRRAIELELGAPSVVTLRAPTAAAVALVPATGAPRVEVFPERLAWSVLAPAGRTRFELRGLGGEPLGGRLEVAVDATEPAGEGLGAENLLEPGRARAYRFRVERTGLVGVGVRASTGDAEVELADATGAPLGRGLVLWRELEPGDYLLAVMAPPDASPMLIQPALVGIAPPATGPPAATVRALVALERGEPPAPRAVVGAEPARALAADAAAAPAGEEIEEIEESEGEEWEEETEEGEEGVEEWDEESGAGGGRAGGRR